LACVTDSNVWIDLHVSGLVERAFDLPFQWIAPDVVVAELEEPSGKELVRRGLQECGLSGPEVQMVADLAAIYPRPSRADLFALVLARERGLMLVTGDADLREAAEQQGVRAHGTLWLLDNMVTHGVINEGRAYAALLKMREAKRRLPREAVEARLRRWRPRAE
jgi:predicted nucleic acid-binding protein